MKTLFIFILTITTVTLFSSCKRENEEQNFVDDQTARNEEEILSYIAAKGLQMQKDENGIYYKITGTPTGESPDTTFRYVELKYEIRVIPNETPIDTNYKLSGTKKLIAPVINPATGGGSIISPRGIDVFMQLNKQIIFKGQKATLLMNHTQGFGTASTPFLPPYSALRVDLEVVNVKSEEQYISERLQVLGLTATQNVDGVVYARTQVGTGEDVIKDSSKVTVKYIGRRVIDNTIFDSGQSFTFQPYTGVISGWKKGIPLMKKIGEKGYLLIPSKLGYGATGINNIRPYTPLYFEVEILNVTNE